MSCSQMRRQNTATSHTLWLKPHSTKNTIKLAPQWTPTITGYMERRKKLSTGVGSLAIAANPMIFWNLRTIM